LIGEERKLAADPFLRQEDEEEEAATNATASNTTLPPPAAAATITASSRKITTIFIGGLHPRILQAHLEKMCQPYGTIERLHFCDKKGYAFCQYQNSDQAQAAMAALDGRGLLGRRLMVRPAHDQHHNGSNNLHQHATTTSGGGRDTSSSQSQNQHSKNPEKERERIEAKIQAVKRKLQDAQAGG
jgi:RNA recognition motif-containing protein